MKRRDQRHRSREAALQMLYQWEVGGASPDDVVLTFWRAHGPEPPLTERGREFAEHLVRGTVADLPAIDPLLAKAAAHWRLDRMALVDRLILRLAVFELRHEAGTPPAVVINEAIELARTFSGDESVGFINGVLDGVRKALAAGAAQGS
jgi:N utilization substance protein B